MARKNQQSRVNSSTATYSNRRSTSAMTSNDQEQFVITLVIFQLLQSLNESGIHPIIVLDLHRRPRNLQGLPVCGAVFLRRKESSLERLTSLELKALGFPLTKTLEDAIHSNWRHFDFQKRKGVASNHHTIPSFTVSTVGDDNFEYSALKTKWTVLGGRNVVDANSKESMTKLKDILSWVGERTSDMASLLKTFGIPLEIVVFYNLTELVKELLKDPGKDPVKAVSCGVGVFLLLSFGLSKRSSPCANWITGAAAISSVALFFWKLIYPLPFAYIMCFVSLCAVSSFLYYFKVLIDKNKSTSPS